MLAGTGFNPAGGKEILVSVVYTAPLLLMWCVYIYKINNEILLNVNN